MTHSIKLLCLDKYRLAGTMRRNFYCTIDGSIYDGHVLLVLLDVHKYSYRLKMDNKEIQKHPDYKEIRAELLRQMCNTNNSMANVESVLR